MTVLMKIRNALLAAVFTVLVAGCQSSRQMSLLPRIPNEVVPSRIHLLRPYRFAGDGIAHGLYLDGQLITQIGSGDYTIFTVAPGTHMVAVKADGIMGGGAFRIECEAGRDYYFRATFNIVPLSEADGKKLAEGLHLVTTDRQ